MCAHVLGIKESHIGSDCCPDPAPKGGSLENSESYAKTLYRRGRGIRGAASVSHSSEERIAPRLNKTAPAPNPHKAAANRFSAKETLSQRRCLRPSEPWQHLAEASPGSVWTVASLEVAATNW